MRKSIMKIINAIIYIVLSSILINADDNTVDKKINVTSRYIFEDGVADDAIDDIHIKIHTKDIELLGGEDITIDYYIISNHKKTLKFKYKIGSYSYIYKIPYYDEIPSPPCGLSVFIDGHYGEKIEKIHTLNQYQYLSGKTKIQTPDRKGVYDLDISITFTLFIDGKSDIAGKSSKPIKVIVINNPKNTNENSEESSNFNGPKQKKEE